MPQRSTPALYGAPALVATLAALARQGTVDADVVERAAKEYGLG